MLKHARALIFVLQLEYLGDIKVIWVCIHGKELKQCCIIFKVQRLYDVADSEERTRTRAPTYLERKETQTQTAKD